MCFKKDAIIFDLDGTLWNSSVEVARSWSIALANMNIPIRLEEKDIAGVMGLPMDEIAKRLFPGYEEKERFYIYQNCAIFENEYLRSYPGKLFPGVVDTLKELGKHYRIYIVSNCQSGYIESFIYGTKTKRLFDGFTCWGDTSLSKGENIKQLMAKKHIGKAIYIGDTAMDEKETRKAGIPFIHASYGFGKVESPDASIESFAELPEVVKSIFASYKVK